MKILKFVSVPDVEIEVDISGAEAVRAILGDLDGFTPHQLLMRTANNLAAFFKNLPDSVIAELNDAQRKIIADFFEQQSLRFRKQIPASKI
jgi:histidinol dehydrogenase